MTTRLCKVKAETFVDNPSLFPEHAVTDQTVSNVVNEDERGIPRQRKGGSFKEDAGSLVPAATVNWFLAKHWCAVACSVLAQPPHTRQTQTR